MKPTSQVDMHSDSGYRRLTGDEEDDASMLALVIGYLPSLIRLSRSAAPALAEAAVSTGITPAKEGRFDKVAGIAEVAGPGAASDCHGNSSLSSSPRRAAATS